MRKKTLCKRGFTLVELLIVAAMLAVVGMVVFGTFVRGFDFWKRISQPMPSEDVSLFFKNVTFDLRNSFKMTGLAFRGKRDEVGFPTRIKKRDKEKTQDSIGYIRYSFDRRRKRIQKTQLTYSEVYRKKKGLERTIAEGISSLEFRYFSYDPETKKYAWTSTWQEKDTVFDDEKEENLPLIVRVEVGIPKERKEQKFTETVYLPSACCWPFNDEDENE